MRLIFILSFLIPIFCSAQSKTDTTKLISVYCRDVYIDSFYRYIDNTERIKCNNEIDLIGKNKIIIHGNYGDEIYTIKYESTYTHIFKDKWTRFICWDENNHQGYIRLLFFNKPITGNDIIINGTLYLDFPGIGKVYNFAFK